MSYSAGKTRRLSQEEILVKKLLGNQTSQIYATGSRGLHVGSENQFSTFVGPGRALQRERRYEGQLHSRSPGCPAANCRWVNRSCRTYNRERKEKGGKEWGKKGYIYSLLGFLRKTVADGGRNSKVFNLQQRKIVFLKVDKNLGSG